MLLCTHNYYHNTVNKFTTEGRIVAVVGTAAVAGFFLSCFSTIPVVIVAVVVVGGAGAGAGWQW